MKILVRTALVVSLFGLLAVPAHAVFTVWSTQIAEVRAYNIGFDPDGNVFVVTNAFPLVKYDRDGEVLWMLDPPESPEAYNPSQQVVVDDAGDVYLVGTYWDSVEEERSIITAKIDGSDGSRLWSERWNIEGEGTSRPVAAALGPDDTIYVTGSTGNYVTCVDAFVTLKYDTADGTLEWSNLYEDVETSHRTPEAITVDDAGDVYVTGRSYDPGVQPFMTVKLDGSDGTPIWYKEFFHPDAENNIAKLIAVDGMGHVIVSGWFELLHPVRLGYLTVQYDADDGEVLWSDLYRSSDTSEDYVEALVTDAAGNVYLTGTTEESDAAEIHATVKYDVDGTREWVETYTEPAATYSYVDKDNGWLLAADAAGDVYTTGPSKEKADEGLDFLTRKLSGDDGTELWHVAFGSPALDEDYAQDLFVDGDDVFVTGHFKDAAGGSNAVTFRYSQCGCLMGEVCYEEGAVNPDNSCLVCDSAASERNGTDASDGAACDDGEFCNGADSCLDGLCVDHAGTPCPDDGLWCTGEEFCDEIGEACAQVNVPCDAEIETCNEDTDACEPLSDDDDDDSGNDDDDSAGDDDSGDDDDADMESASSSSDDEACGE